VTSVMAGVYTVTVALSGFALGAIVDRYKKKTAMMLSSIATFVFFSLALLIYTTTPPERFTHYANYELWLFLIVALAGSLAGNLRGIALSTLVTFLIPEDERDRANGMVGTANGVSFLVGSIL